jgi:hypothetical protein
MDKLLFCGDAEQGKTAGADTEGKVSNGYDIILMAETVYALSSLPNLYRLIKKVNIQNFHFAEYSFSNIKICLISLVLHTLKAFLQCLSYPGGVVYMAGKKHYFGVGGGTRQFLRFVEKDSKLYFFLTRAVNKHVFFVHAPILPYLASSRIKFSFCKLVELQVWELHSDRIVYVSFLFLLHMSMISQ